jgi:protein pelota
MMLRIGNSITITKDRKWNNLKINILRRSANASGFILIAIDTQEAAIAKVSGTHLDIMPNIYSGKSGKQYPQATKRDSKVEAFFEDVSRTIISLITQEKDKSTVLIFGPGETKRKFHNFLIDAKKTLKKDIFTVIDGVDVAGEDGIYVFLRSSTMMNVMSSSKLASVSSILDEIMHLVHKSENKFAMGIQEVRNAASIKAISHLVISDSIFKTATESDVINLLNSVEDQGVKTYAVDSSTDIGLRISSLGGIIALLRYTIR